MISNILLLTQLQQPVPPIDVADDYTYLKSYCHQFNLNLKVFIHNLAVLDVLLTKSVNDPEFFWNYRYEVIFQLRTLLAGQEDLLAQPDLLVECNDITLKYIYLLWKYSFWLADPAMVERDPRFFEMYRELLYAFTLFTSGDLPYIRCCFSVLRYTIEALEKKANESEGEL